MNRIYYATVSGPKQINYYAEYLTAWGIMASTVSRQEYISSYGMSGVSKEGLELDQYGASGRTHFSFLIDQNIMHAYDIVSHLQGQIALKSEIPNKNYSLSIRDWEDDIMFTHNYKSEKNSRLRTFVYEKPE